MPAKHDYPTEDRDLGGDFRVYWSKLRRTPGVGWEVLVACGKHPDRWVMASDAIKDNFTGRCKKCYVQDMPHKLTGELILPKGTKVLYDVRDGRRVGIECRGCFDPELQNIKYVDYSNLWAYVNGHVKWDELCSECIKARGSLKRHVEDKQSLVSETWTRFSEEKDGMVPVDAALCGCRWWTTRVNAVNNWHIYSDICLYHQQHPRELAALLLKRERNPVPLAQTQSGNGQKKRPRGRQAGETVYDPAEVRAVFESIVLKLSETLSDRKITRTRIAAEYNANGERIDDSTVTKRVQMAYGDGVTVADAVDSVLKEKRERVKV